MTRASTPENEPLLEQRTLLSALMQSLAASGEQVNLFETHISLVIVTPRLAWKFKKPVRIDVLDFTSLDARRHYCEEELRLNRRTAPDIYLGVDAIAGTPGAPRLVDIGQASEDAPALDYAVRMRSFPQEALWEQRAARHALGYDEAAALGRSLGQFHRDAAVAEAGSEYGDPAALLAVSRSNRHEIAALLDDDAARAQLRSIDRDLESLHAALAPLRRTRKSEGRVRECHGDLHCGNLLTLDGRPLAFDCIEFNPALRWLDVIDDIAFAIMDLRMVGEEKIAACLLDAWLQESGDYGGLRLLNPAMAERALVRCKVGLLRAKQQETDAAIATRARALGYLALARRCLDPQPARLVITHGFSGSGKSTVAAELARMLGALRLRSDVERKRLLGMAATTHPTGAERLALYTEQARLDVYAHLAQQAAHVLASGMTAVVDATFLLGPQRDMFLRLAIELGVPLLILDCRADPAVLRQRLLARQRAGADPSDADIAVLEQQLGRHDVLRRDEAGRTIVVETGVEAPEDAARRVVGVVEGAGMAAAPGM
ncbi:bifunctional aminoglycoside phosphotransferase/ATP-binding protein [Lacisediminimonas profundi]|uniref:bifunctional aminoglycoside phosphotransferase/ATP-binding protein n=1 Tax=Lacisediminimonas profundi TaxID=2603856 RepID=UPI00124B5D42|nr:bifunctional aminoglycoside phosphotransferase/ATP-binding protein [Lacisediminimonas profundi]